MDIVLVRVDMYVCTTIFTYLYTSLSLFLNFVNFSFLFLLDFRSLCACECL